MSERVVLFQIAVKRILQRGNIQIVKALRPLKRLASLHVVLALHEFQDWCVILAAPSHHDQSRNRMAACKGEDVLSKCVTVDRRSINTEQGAPLLQPMPRQEEIEIALAIGVGNVPLDNPIVDNPPAIVAAPADQ